MNFCFPVCIKRCNISNLLWILIHLLSIMLLHNFKVRCTATNPGGLKNFGVDMLIVKDFSALKSLSYVGSFRDSLKVWYISLSHCPFLGTTAGSTWLFTYFEMTCNLIKLIWKFVFDYADDRSGSYPVYKLVGC